MATKTATEAPRIKQAPADVDIGRRLADLQELAARYNRIGQLMDEGGRSWNEAARAEGAEWRERESGTPE